MYTDNITGDQTVGIASGTGPNTPFSAFWKSPFRLSTIKSLFTAAVEENHAAETMTARGTHEHSIRNEKLEVGTTGVTVQMSDLSIPLNQKETVTASGKRILPLLTQQGHAEITGSSSADNIKVKQDAKGNTILTVTTNGQESLIDLGKIASLTLYGGGGTDTIDVEVKDYYGGIEVDAGDGDDKVTVNADNTLKRGVTIRGGAGDDNITISGKAMMLMVSGNGGNDIITATKVEEESTLSRTIEGNSGSDIIYGSRGEDNISGGDGSDLLIGNEGNDRIKGDDGNDTIYGDSGMDRIEGGSGNDHIHGGNNADSMSGGDGSDYLMGESGGDSLYGGNGTDYLYGGSSNNEAPMYSSTGQVSSSGLYNWLKGGAGADIFAPSSASPSEIVANTGDGSYLLDYDSAIDQLL